MYELKPKIEFKANLDATNLTFFANEKKDKNIGDFLVEYFSVELTK
jgi:hypothetical protein